MLRISKLIFILFLFSVFVSPVSAHGDAVSVPKDTGDYTIEFEYGEPVIIEGETTSYVFRLLDQKAKTAVVFDSVLVRIEQKSDQTTYLVARLSPDELQDGVARFTGMLNKGDYAVAVGFYKSDTKIAEETFDLSVQKTETNPFPTVPAVSLAVGVLIGLIASKLFARLR